MVCYSIGVEDNIANLTLLIIGQDADLVRLVGPVILECLKGDVLGFDSDGLPVHLLVGLVLWLEAHPDAGHDIVQVFILVRNDGLYAHTWFVFGHERGQVRHQLGTLILDPV